ncbi:unnamed protein product [Durusdinium trenchii]|uniref:Uncharacterized protein n=1 Tax=Durusdinium trenchii TaxID=1381693 RepID=A0ABP0Q6W5_9DINO
MDPSPEGFPSPDWAGVFSELPCLLHPLRLQLLCGGLGAPEHFLDQQQIPFVADPYVDNAVFLAPALQSLYGQGHRGTVLFTEANVPSTLAYASESEPALRNRIANLHPKAFVSDDARKHLPGHVLKKAANRIAKIQPDAFLLEQVPDIVKHKKFFGNVLAKLRMPGYTVKHKDFARLQLKGFQPTAFSRRLSLGAAQAMLWLWRRKELHLAHMTEHSCALTPQTLVTKAGTKKFFFVLASTCHGAWTWEAEVVETQTYTLRGHNEWAWLTVTNVKDWHCVPYEWTINKVQTEQFGFLCMKQRGTPFEQQEHELLENLLESADATVKSSYMVDGDASEASDSDDDSLSDDDDPMPEYTLAALEHIEATGRNAFGVAASSAKQKEQKRHAMLQKYKRAIEAEHLLADEAEDPGPPLSGAPHAEDAVEEKQAPTTEAVEAETLHSHKSNLPAIRRFVPDRPCTCEGELCSINWIQGAARGEHWIARYSFSVPADVTKVKRELKQSSRTKYTSSNVSEHMAFQRVLSWIWQKHTLCTSDEQPAFVTDFLRECPACKADPKTCTAMNALKTKASIAALPGLEVESSESRKAICCGFCGLQDHADGAKMRAAYLRSLEKRLKIGWIEIWAPAATSEHADLLLVGQVGPSGGSKKAVAIVWRQTHYETLVS